MGIHPNIAKTWILHHNNATAYAARSVQQFLTSKSIMVLPQPPYSPDLAPCNIF
jgi:transposase